MGSLLKIPSLPSYYPDHPISSLLSSRGSSDAESEGSLAQPVDYRRRSRQSTRSSQSSCSPPIPSFFPSSTLLSEDELRSSSPTPPPSSHSLSRRSASTPSGTAERARRLREEEVKKLKAELRTVKKEKIEAVTALKKERDEYKEEAEMFGRLLVSMDESSVRHIPPRPQP